MQQDAELRQRKASREAESCRVAKNEVEASLAAAQERCETLELQLQQTQLDSKERVDTLKTELGKTTKKIRNLSDQLTENSKTG